MKFGTNADVNRNESRRAADRSGEPRKADRPSNGVGSRSEDKTSTPQPEVSLGQAEPIPYPEAGIATRLFPAFAFVVGLAGYLWFTKK